MKTYYVCHDHYGKPIYDETQCFYINPSFIIRAWKEERQERKFGTEFEQESNTYFMGEIAERNQVITFHFLRTDDWNDFTGENI